MKISVRLNNVLNITLLRSCSIDSRGYRVANLHETPVNTMFLNVKSNSDHIEIPMFAFENIIENIVIKDGNFNTDIVIPINTIYRGNGYKTTDLIISYLLSSIPSSDAELNNNYSEKHGTYYGSRGLIMDNNKRILFLVTAVCTIVNGDVKAESFKVYVHPKVSISENGIEKTIYTKLVPKCLTEKFSTYFPYRLKGIAHINANINVVFKDVTDKFFVTPNSPTDFNYEDTIKDLVVNNIDTFIDISSNVH